jgi:ABC transport system ATP-binding/permease protein
VRALEQLRLERQARRERMGDPKMAIQEAARSGRLVAEAEKMTFAYPAAGAAGSGGATGAAATGAATKTGAAAPPLGRPIIKDFSTTVIRGDRVGIFGPNGAGKTTLLKLLLGELTPQKGRVRLGANLEVAYFDQLRATLDEERNLRDNILDGGEIITMGKSGRHVVGYLQDFLFAPEQINAPVRLLSGGERNRLLLAKMFAVPSNVLVLDEHTNDLDMETLGLLEERLLTYQGTILLVSHDREFLNNVVTSTLVFDDDVKVREYAGGYDDWVRQRAASGAAAAPKTAPAAGAGATPSSGGTGAAGASGSGGAGAASRPAKRKLSYKETKELEALPEKIETLEAERAEIAGAISSPDFYTGGDSGRAMAAHQRLEALQAELDAAYLRWEELEAIVA